MGDIGEIRAGLDKIKGHVEGQQQSVKQGNEQAEAGYQKLRVIHDHLMQAWVLSRELDKDFKDAADTIKTGADTHLVGIAETATAIGLEGMKQAAARELIGAIGNLTLQSDAAMMGFRRTAGKIMHDAEGDIALPRAINHAIRNGDNVESEFGTGAWAAAEFADAATAAHGAIEKIVL